MKPSSLQWQRAPIHVPAISCTKTCCWPMKVYRGPILEQYSYARNISNHMVSIHDHLLPTSSATDCLQPRQQPDLLVPNCLFCSRNRHRTGNMSRYSEVLMEIKLLFTMDGIGGTTDPASSLWNRDFRGCNFVVSKSFSLRTSCVHESVASKSQWYFPQLLFRCVGNSFAVA